MTTTQTDQRFIPGQQIIVQPCAYDLSPAWDGEIVNYWRNGAWIVREMVHGTTCAIDADRISTY